MSDDFENMSIEQLEGIVDQEGATAEAPAQQTQATETAPAQTESQEEAPPKWFEKHQQDLKRELGSFRSLMSLKDQLPKLVQQEAAKQLAELKEAQQNVNLSPEDQDARAQLEAQKLEWAKFIREQSRAEFSEGAKEYIDILNELREQKQYMGLKNATLDLVKDVIPEKSQEAWESVFEQSYKDIEAGKPGAIERQTRLEKDPAFVALAMIQAQRSKVQGQANQFSEKQTASAKAAAQTVKSGSVTSGAKKNIAEMDEKELDGMSISELEAALPEQSR